MTTQMNGTNGLPLNSTNINAAMRFMYDLGEAIQYPFILMGETAKQVVDNPDSYFDLHVDHIELGIPSKQMTPETISTLKIYHFKENEKGWEYSWEGVPIQLYVITRKYKFFDNLDTKFYKIDEFKLANPFAAYWKARAIVK